MIIGKKQLIKASNIMFNYLLDLEDNEINDLIEGSKIIALVEKNQETKKIEVEVKSLEEINKVKKLDEITAEDIIGETINKINRFTTREEASLYLNQKIFTVKLLKVIAKKSDIYLKSKSKKSEIIDKIIEATVGASLKHKILKEG